MRATTAMNLTHPSARVMRVTAIALWLLVTCANTTIGHAQTPSLPGDDEDGPSSSFTPLLIGSWSSAPDEVPLATPFDVSVWGPGAKSVRDVHLKVDKGGQATLTVSRKVVDRRGKTVLGSASIETASLRLGASHVTVSTRREHDVDVVNAVRTYPDDPSDRWDISGLKVKVITFDDGDGRTLEVRFEPAEGRGSFWETLRRTGTSTSSRVSGSNRPRRS